MMENLKPLQLQRRDGPGLCSIQLLTTLYLHQIVASIQCWSNAIHSMHFEVLWVFVSVEDILL